MAGQSQERDHQNSRKLTRRTLLKLGGTAFLIPKLLEPSAAKAAVSEFNDTLTEIRSSIPPLVFPEDPQKEDGGYLGKNPQTEAIASNMYQTTVAVAILAGGALAEDAAWYKSIHPGITRMNVPSDKLHVSLEWRAPTSEAIQGIIEGKPYEVNGQKISPQPNPGFKPVKENPFWQVYNIHTDPSGTDKTRINHYFYVNAEQEGFDPYSLNHLYSMSFFKARVEQVNKSALQGITEGNATPESLRSYITKSGTQQKIYAYSALTGLKNIAQLVDSTTTTPWTITDNLKQRANRVNQIINSEGEAKAIEFLIESSG